MGRYTARGREILKRVQDDGRVKVRDDTRGGIWGDT